MSSYNFSMSKVLEYREDLEKSFIEKFSSKQNQLLGKQEELRHLLNEYNTIKQKTASYKCIDDMVREQLYRQNLADKILVEENHLNNLSGELELAREELVNAQKDRKIMEKLKEKDYTKFQSQLKIMEQKDLDEITSLKYVRRVL